MKNLQFCTEVSAGKKVLSIELTQSQTIDLIALNTLINDPPKQVVPITYLEVNNKKILRYECNDVLDFKYMPMGFSYKEYARILEDLVDFLLSCDNWFLNYNSFVFDYNHIFFTKENFLIKLIYLPVKGLFATEEQIKLLLTHLIKDYQVENGQALQYELLKAIIEPSFSLEDITRVITKTKQAEQKLLTTNTSVTTEHRHKQAILVEQVPDSIFEAEIEDCDLEKVSKPVNENVYEVLKNLNNKPQPRKKSFWSYIFGKSNSQKEKVLEVDQREEQPRELMVRPEESPKARYYSSLRELSHTEVINGNASATCFLILEQGQGYHNLPTEIAMEFKEDFFTIGRRDLNKKVSSIYEFDSSVKSISRIHARFERNDNKLFLVDLHSVNGTYVNDNKLIPNIPVQIKAQDKISFSSKITYVLNNRDLVLSD